MKQLEMIKGYCGSDVVKYLYVGANMVWPAEEPEPIVPETEIWYTSTDGNIVVPSSQSVFGANLISNTYENGKGILKFDGPVTKLGESHTGTASIQDLLRAPFRLRNTLKTINLPNSITSIGINAFSSCVNLEKINIPVNISGIYLSAFDTCTKLKKLVIPDSCSYIGREAFLKCEDLVSINIPNSVTKIETETFYYCTSLSSIIIPDSLTRISSWAFIGCSSLSSITSYAKTTPILDTEVFNNIFPTGTLYYPAGSDYSTWKSALPSGWTYVEI